MAKGSTAPNGFFFGFTMRFPLLVLLRLTLALGGGLLVIILGRSIPLPVLLRFGLTPLGRAGAGLGFQP